jgi:hypothetical protein
MAKVDKNGKPEPGQAGVVIGWRNGAIGVLYGVTYESELDRQPVSSETPIIPNSPQSARGGFPGLNPPEAAVLRRWLALHEGEYDKIDYNVRVGAGDDPGEQYDESTRRQAILNTQKRIDVVAWKGSAATLIEVKTRATAAAIGQLVTYSHLWADTYPGHPNPKLLVIATSAVSELPDVMRRANIAFELVSSAD